MNFAVDSLLRDVGQVIWEIQITGEAAGDTLLDTPTLTTKKHRVYGIFSFMTKELFEKIGTSTQADAVLFTREQLTMTSQIEHNDIRYEITDERIIDPLHVRYGYVYILHKHPKRIA